MLFILKFLRKLFLIGPGGLAMFATGNVTVSVSNMDQAVRFYSETLGLKLLYRFGDHWASLQAGKGLTIGLHPASANSPPGRKGSMSIGLELTGNIEDAMRIGRKRREILRTERRRQSREVRRL
jgi:catechol-2,3-dioxygenase